MALVYTCLYCNVVQLNGLCVDTKSYPVSVVLKAGKVEKLQIFGYHDQKPPTGLQPISVCRGKYFEILLIKRWLLPKEENCLLRILFPFDISVAI